MQVYMHISEDITICCFGLLLAALEIFFFLNHSNKPKIINNIKNIQVTDSLKDGGKLQK